MTVIRVEAQTPVDEARLAEMVSQNAERCCYCQNRVYPLENPKVTVVPSIKGSTLPKLVAHMECDEPVQAWKTSRR